jgi:hypothetical protein
VERVRAAGVSMPAIKETIHVYALFNIINRLADAFDFDPMRGISKIRANLAHYRLHFSP